MLFRSEVAANASSNRHDFLIALDRALKEQTVAVHKEPDRLPDHEPDNVSEPEPQPEPEPDEVADEVPELPRLRVAGQ